MNITWKINKILRIHDTLVPKMTANVTFMPFLCFDLITSQGRVPKVTERLIHCYCLDEGIMYPYRNCFK